ncbi:ribonuclease H-like domain-containing protein [Nannocystis punicea]|uniref:Ribonuclease H-like domain-containing protein n=1 Tax=Nannocystis punicea TaxID=2995304 RepID=A0ABY7HA96_9BACT|nr:ribonuclease H-like domain-containing protein [Nannocystis poenicansa]WAS96208.1 ribonuclease H-like domain-containing protein [Nannocystis poenicansa]
MASAVSERPALWRRMVRFEGEGAAPALPRAEAGAGFVREVTRWPCRGARPPLLVGRGLELPGPAEWRAAFPCLYGHVDTDMSERAVFLDLESTGLGHGAGTVAFVVGLATLVGDGWQIEQWLLTQLSGEVALLADLEARVRALGGPLVTFNGASFDLPLLRGRLRRCGLPTDAFAGTHLDLLPVARRLWRGRGPDCRLTTLERTQLGVRRDGDIAGRAIPEVFWTALRQPHEARAREAVRRVVGHNLVDVLTMPALAGAMVRTLAAPGDPELVERAADHRNAIGRRLRQAAAQDGARRTGTAGRDAAVQSPPGARTAQDPLPRRVAHLGS